MSGRSNDHKGEVRLHLGATASLETRFFAFSRRAVWRAGILIGGICSYIALHQVFALSVLVKCVNRCKHPHFMI